MDAKTNIKLHVVGTHLDSEGYPNVRYRIQSFRQADWLEVTEINQPMWKKLTRSKHSKLGLFIGIFRALYAHLFVIGKYVVNGRVRLVYIPYPAVFVGFILAILPRAIKPDRIVLDAFISLYDTVVNDRKILSSTNWAAILLKAMEKKAYYNADVVIVDTPQSKNYFCSEFNISETKLIDIPLSTDEDNYQLQTYPANNDVCQVLFIGTFVPLHGVATILAAAAELKDCQNIKFTIVGSGQTATALGHAFKKVEHNLEWISAWQSSERLAEMIAQADICLGIFGSGKKAQRVCPFKLYSYAACGRAIITGDTEWARHATLSLTYKPFETVPVNDSVSLASRIKQLAGSLDYRQQLAKNSGRFYQEQLSNKLAFSKLEMLLRVH